MFAARLSSDPERLVRTARHAQSRATYPCDAADRDLVPAHLGFENRGARVFFFGPAYRSPAAAWSSSSGHRANARDRLASRRPPIDAVLQGVQLGSSMMKMAWAFLI